jgi:hypothetical protein
VPDEVEAACSDGRPACAPRSSATSGPLRLRAHSGGDASNPSDAMVPRWTLSVFGVDAPSTPSVRTGHNPPIAVVGSEFLGRGISCESGGVDTRVPTSPLIETIRASVIGDDEVMDGPYGPGGSSTPTTPPKAPRTAGPQGRGRVDRSSA